MPNALLRINSERCKLMCYGLAEGELKVLPIGFFLSLEVLLLLLFNLLKDVMGLENFSRSVLFSPVLRIALM
jgi:hypothetical protein